MMVVRENTKTSFLDDKNATHAIGNVSLLANPDGKAPYAWGDEWFAPREVIVKSPSYGKQQ
jgi:hypothetical protein